MKKLFYLVVALIFATSFTSNAQSTKRVSAASSGTVGDTITFNPMPSRLKSIQYQVNKLTGTIAGKVIYEGTVSGAWIPIDTLTLANQAINTKLFTIPQSTGTTYLGYRFRYEPTGTQTSTFVSVYLRRTDE